MVLIKKVDVNQHFAARRAMRRNAFQSVSQPLPSTRPGTEPIAAKPEAPGFSEDFILEHSSSSAPVTSLEIGAESDGIHVPAAPRSWPA